MKWFRVRNTLRYRGEAGHGVGLAFAVTVALDEMRRGQQLICTFR